jgi:hypothetical protein
MAVITTHTGRGATYYTGEAVNTSNPGMGTPTMVYASDGTAITVDYELASNYDRFRLTASAEANPKTVAKTYTHTAQVGSSSYMYDYTVGGSTSYTFQLQSVIDQSDTVIVPVIGSGNSGTIAGAIYLIKFAKPAEGWRAWAANGSTALTVTTGSAASTLNFQGTSGTIAYTIKGVIYTGSGHIVVATYYTSGTIATGFHYGLYSINTSTGAIVNCVGIGAGSSTSTTGLSLMSGVQFGKFSQSGGFWWNNGTTTATDQCKFTIFNVSSIGTITVANQGKLFSTTLDTFNAGLNKKNRIASVYLKDNKILSIARASGSASYYIRVDQISQTGTGVSGSISDISYGSIPSGGYASGAASTFSLYPQSFIEEGFVRIWQVSDSGTTVGYVDVFVNLTTNTITWDTTSFGGFSFGGQYPSLYNTLQEDSYGRYYDFISSTGTDSTFNSNAITLPAGASWSTYTTGPTSASFTSPTVSTLNLQGGIKFQLAPVGAAGGRGSLSSGNCMAQNTPAGYQLKRTIGGVDSYYNATTQTFGASPVTNANIAPTLTVDIPASAGFASSGTYAFSLALVDVYSVATPFGTTDSITSIDASAPATVTAKRFLRKTMAASTDAHEYTFNTTALINKITIANGGAGSSTVALKVGGFYLVAPVEISAGATLTVDTSHLVDGDDRVLLTSSNSGTDIYISGTEGI